MFKRVIKLSLVVVGAVTASFIFPVKGTAINDLRLDNVEALANGEVDADYWCYSEGTIECNGHKVKYKISNYR